ncbi:MAG: hypothetical protein AAFQ32_00555 [Pseudomonadota bacterium]
MSHQVKNIVLLHLFAEVSTENEAREIGERLCQRLNAFGKQKICRMKPYWKTPKYFEFSIEIFGANLSEDQIHNISAILGGNWIGAGRNLVWNFEGDKTLIEPKLRWASLEHLEE